MMDKIKFKNEFNIFLYQNNHLMLELALKVSDFKKMNYLRMQAFSLCDYKDGITFNKAEEERRIVDFFTKVMWKSYTIRLEDEFFSNELLTRLKEKFDFLKNLPSNYLIIYQEFQKELFDCYWQNIDEIYLKKLFELCEVFSYKIQGELYSRMIYLFLGSDLFIIKKNKKRLNL